MSSSIRKNRVFIIAEAGTSHGGSIERARQLIEAASKAGADGIKFQAVYADEIIHRQTGMVPLPGGQVSLYEQFRHLERPPEFYGRLKEESEAAGLSFLCTPFGPQSALMLYDLGVESFKVASPELNYKQLLELLSGYQRPLILSAGVSRISDIENALLWTESSKPSRTASFPARTLLHCITSYPAPEEEYNLRVIESLRSIFGVPVGISDHSIDPVLVPALSASVGASMLEKHLTLSRKDGGLDDPIALDPNKFREMVESVRHYERLSAKEIQNDLAKVYGKEHILRVLGDGIKRLAPSEKASYGRSNRSIHAGREIRAGEILSTENTAILRTEKELLPGLEPQYLEQILGARATRPIKDGQGIGWIDVISGVSGTSEIPLPGND
ncbi:MAG: N-acetylneuraminate synthase family protein [Spirochaetales bacterium]|nr:N-acetylneuraminate synthase family protein [Spirochaetales bacterium]MCF7938392.1 N-acetylneuraminate synthase family protein [Spirochaetales bacterium]